MAAWHFLTPGLMPAVGSVEDTNDAGRPFIHFAAVGFVYPNWDYNTAVFS